ncbi:unnamed protein product [Rhodiola kirilowii]
MRVMMMTKVTAILLLSTLLVASVLEADVQPPPVDCGYKCGKRCQNAGVKDRCLKFCGICCRECKCVPSGTYGNKHECPCYRDKLSSKGKPKCP